MAEQKQSNKDRLREITEGIEQGIKELFESEKYRQYLSVMSRFHRYSVNNTMLIYMQRPDATLVAGYNKWRDQFERHVKRGEHGITIIAPTPYRKKVEEQKLDPDTKAPMLDAEGKVIMEEKTIEIPMFKPVKVFDVSQTDGKPLPHLASDLTGNVQQFDVFMEALRRTSPVPISILPVEPDTDGFFNLDSQSITIRAGMSEVQTVSAVVHEITHALLHNDKEEPAPVEGDAAQPAKKKDRHTEEVEAESVSYAVCQYFSIQTGDNSFGYIAEWSQGKELKELRESLETINKTANQLITSIDRHFKEICKERGIDLSVSPQPVTEEKEALTLDQYPMPDPQLTVADLEAHCYLDGDMLPLSRDRAMELHEKDFTIYAISGDGDAEMIFDAEDFTTHADTVIFAVEREEWERSPDFHQLTVDRLSQQEQREQAFLQYNADCFAIYQQRDDSPGRFRPFDEQKDGIQRSGYDLVYTGELSGDVTINAHLGSLWYKFNQEHPVDYHRPSLSVSDIVALKVGGVVSCHYVDSIGYKEVPDFIQPENYLRNAEMTIEDDYNMIDGIINNGTRQTEPAPEQKKKSVMEQLREKPKQPRKKTAHKRSAEQEL